MSRTDIHRPSLADPAEYTFKAAFYQGASDAMHDAYMLDMRDYDAAVENFPSFSGNYAEKATCDHCGAAFNHGVLFLHVPSGELVHVGHICAANTVGLPSKAAATRKRAEQARRNEVERQKRQEAGAKWQSENSDVVEYLTKYSVEVRDTGRKSHPFLDDMVRSLHKWGTLFPNQANAVRKFIANDAKPRPERTPEPEPTTPLEEGRRVITGKIVSTKWKDTMYGNTPKMLVRQDDGNKVWGTVPEHGFLVDPDTGATEDLDALRGMKVTLTAKVERSRDDEHFGFFSRPSGMTTEDVAS